MNTDKRHRFPSDIISYETIRLSQYANNQVEQSQETTRVREGGMKKFNSVVQAQRLVTAHAAVKNLFNPGG